MKFITVPNNEEGKTFITSLRKFLKNTPKRVKVRGRGPRKIHAKDNSYWTLRRLNQDLPLDLSTSFAVYIENRDTYRYKKVTKQVTEWVRVPTKWAAQ